MNQSVESHYLKGLGAPVHYYAAGKGKPLVLLHGGGSDSSQWLPSISLLALRHRVYAPDLPGFGRSPVLAGGYSLSGLAEFLGRFVSGLGLGRIGLVGHSLGGGLALKFALDFPGQVERLVLVNSLGLGREIAWWVRLLCLEPIARPLGVLARGSWHILGRLSRFVPRPPLPGWLSGVFPPQPAHHHLGREVAGWRGQKLHFLGRLPELEIPTLIVWGAQDEVLPVSQAYRAQRLIPGSRLLVFAECGHSPYRDEARDFHQHLLEFFE